MRWPDGTLIVLFPPLDVQNEEPAQTEETDAAPTRDLPPVVPVPLAAATLPAVLPEMLRSALPEYRGALEPLVAELMGFSPVPLSAQVALLHLHTPLIDSARIAVGRREAGLDLPGFAAQPTELALLLSPRSCPPEQHLRTLAAIARAARAGSLWPRA